VDAHVDVEVALLLELLAAFIAHKGIVANVDALVLGERIRLSETFAA